MVEGTFPKSDGDILYASEVNRFANSSTYFYNNSNATASAESGTLPTVLGSTLIQAGSLISPAHLVVNFTGREPGGNGVINFGVRISGADAEETITMTGSVGVLVAQADIVLDKAISGLMSLQYNGTFKKTDINAINPGSPFVVFYEAGTLVGTGNFRTTTFLRGGPVF